MCCQLWLALGRQLTWVQQGCHWSNYKHYNQCQLAYLSYIIVWQRGKHEDVCVCVVKVLTKYLSFTGILCDQVKMSFSFHYLNVCGCECIIGRGSKWQYSGKERYWWFVMVLHKYKVASRNYKVQLPSLPCIHDIRGNFILKCFIKKVLKLNDIIVSCQGN